MRDTQRQRAAEEARVAAFAKSVRRRRIVGASVVLAVVLAVFAAVGLAKGAKDAKAVKPGPAIDTTTTAFTGNPNPPVSLPTAAPGGAIAGATPCPKLDGSSPRITKFASAPPICSDAAKGYNATIKTTKGDINIRLDAPTAPNSVNNFIVLARYHYYDGLPITSVVPRGWAEIGDPTNADGSKGPGYKVPGETPKEGSIPSAVIVAMVPDPSGASSGAFLFGIADRSSGMPKEATQIGTIMDSRIVKGDGPLDKTVQQEINKIGTKTGAPAEVVTILSVTVDAEGS